MSIEHETDADGGRPPAPTSDWVSVWSVSDLAEGMAVHVDVAGHPVCLARSRGEVHALLDECSHGQVALSDGEVEDGYVECWLHGSSFDLTSGVPAGPPAVRAVPVFGVRVVADRIEVAAPPGPIGVVGGTRG